MMVPQEILAMIFRDLDKRQLCRLAIACKAFQVQAESLLYHTVAFIHHELPIFQVFAIAIASEPRRAFFVQELALPHCMWNEKWRIPVLHPLKETYIPACLQGLLNLRKLRIVGIPERDVTWLSDSASYDARLDMLASIPFHLDTLQLVHKKWSPGDLYFLGTQPGIQVFVADWSLADTYDGSFPSSSGAPHQEQALLPALHTATLCEATCLAHLDTRCIQRLSLATRHFRGMHEYHEKLTRSNLQHLRLTEYVTESTFVEFSQFVCRVWPSRLHSLTLYIGFKDHVFLEQVFDRLAHFAGLHNLVLTLIPVNITEYNPKFLSDVKRFMASRPSLPRVSLLYVLDVEWAMEQQISWTEWGASQGRWVTLVRTQSGDIVEEGVRVVDDESWRTWDS